MANVLSVHQGVHIPVRALIPDDDGAPITRSQVAKVSAYVFDVSGQKPMKNDEHSIDDIDPDDVIFDTLQTASAWPYAQGYNFKHTLPTSVASPLVAGHRYKIEYVIQLVSGGPRIFDVEVSVVPTLSLPSLA